MTWAEYWNGEPSLYVNERHRRMHYERIVHDVIKHVPPGTARLVDYGAGDTLTARELARVCGHLFLCDSARRVRQRLLLRYAGEPNISVITPEEFAALPAGGIDMIVVNSVVQYVSPPEFFNLIEQSREKLRHCGLLLLADIVPRQVGPARDAIELIKFAGRAGFLLPALFGLARSYFSPYRKIRQRYGFLQFEEAELLQSLRQRGFKVERHYPNIGHNAQRMTFRAVAS